MLVLGSLLGAIVIVDEARRSRLLEARFARGAERGLRVRPRGRVLGSDPPGSRRVGRARPLRRSDRDGGLRRAHRWSDRWLRRPRADGAVRSGPSSTRRLLPLGLGYFFARLGCFSAGCDYGKVTTSRFAVTFPAGSYAFRDHVASGALSPDAPFLAAGSSDPALCSAQRGRALSRAARDAVQRRRQALRRAGHRVRRDEERDRALSRRRFARARRRALDVADARRRDRAGDAGGVAPRSRTLGVMVAHPTACLPPALDSGGDPGGIERGIARRMPTLMLGARRGARDPLVDGRAASSRTGLGQPERPAAAVAAARAGAAAARGVARRVPPPNTPSSGCSMCAGLDCADCLSGLDCGDCIDCGDCLSGLDCTCAVSKAPVATAAPAGHGDEVVLDESVEATRRLVRAPPAALRDDRLAPSLASPRTPTGPRTPSSCAVRRALRPSTSSSTARGAARWCCGRGRAPARGPSARRARSGHAARSSRTL